MNAPAEIAKNFLAVGEGKVRLPLGRMFLLAVLAARFQDYDMSVRLLSSIITSRSANSRIKDKARDMKDQVMLDMKKKQQQQG